jgi:predicted fused transcriptional regulator/phosphomethylpyrimidine kinase
MVPRIKESRGNPGPPPCVNSGRGKHTAALIPLKIKNDKFQNVANIRFNKIMMRKILLVLSLLALLP